MAYNLVEATRLLQQATITLATDSIAEVKPRESGSKRYRNHPILCTGLAPHIGYDHAARIAKQARESDADLVDLAVDAGMDRNTAERVLDPLNVARGNDIQE